MAGVTPGAGVTGGSTVPVISGGGTSGSGAASTTGSGALFHHAGAFQDSQPASHGAHNAATANTRATRTAIGYSRLAVTVCEGG
jgi:type IV secretory pathway TrbL component